MSLLLLLLYNSFSPGQIEIRRPFQLTATATASAFR